MGNEKTVQFAPVEIGNMSEIPPDLPPGAWTAACSVKKHATANGNYPMLILEWKTTEALTDGNDDHVGAKATDFVTFFPATHNACRMGRIRLKALCDALDIEVPSATKLTSWDDLSDFIEALDGLQAPIYTTVAPDKNGEMRTRVQYTEPGASLRAAKEQEDEDEDEEEEKAPPKKMKKKLKKSA